MFNNGPYDYNQYQQMGVPQPQMNQPQDMGTSFGYPTAPSGTPMQQMGGQMPVTGAAPVDYDTLPTTPVLDIEYTQGYLKSQIGAKVKVEFLIGTNMLIDREGTLVDVGISYIIIRESETDDLLLCDIYSIKFVRFYY